MPKMLPRPCVPVSLLPSVSCWLTSLPLVHPPVPTQPARGGQARNNSEPIGSPRT